mgnify:FL=1
MKKKRLTLLTIMVLVLTITMSGCGLAFLESQMNALKGSLVGESYNITSYDNYGAKTIEISGEKVDISGNYVKNEGKDEDGNKYTTDSLTSVLTITIDGKQFESCGDTLIFAQKDLEPEVDFSLDDINSTSSGISNLTSISKVVNKYKNYFGKPQVVVIESQMGIPICAYSGKKVYWEIPNDLPKMTKLMIDGKALYIHRANYKIVDKSLIS